MLSFQYFKYNQLQQTQQFEMRRKDKDIKKYLSTTRPTLNNYSFHNQDFLLQDRPIPQDIRQQLRSALEELEHNRLSSQLEVQKRLLLEQQLKTAKQEIDEYKGQNEQLKRQLGKVAKKYSKLKQKKQCEKCRNRDDTIAQLEKQRQIYSNDRKMLQDEINGLKNQLQNSQTLHEREQLVVLVDSLKKQLYLAGKKIQQQNRIVQFLNEKLSIFEIQNLQIMQKVSLLQGKLSEIEIDSVIQKKGKGCTHCSNYSNKHKIKPQEVRSTASLSRDRRNGSIKNVKRTERAQDWQDELDHYQP